MIDEELKLRLGRALAAGPDARTKSLALLRDFKESGGSQQDALDTLEDLRNLAATEDDEDHILEIMDIASGWCQPRHRIW